MGYGEAVNKMLDGSMELDIPEDGEFRHLCMVKETSPIKYVGESDEELEEPMIEEDSYSDDY